MTTTIISNGSKLAGQAPDPIEALYSRLQNYALDPTFEKYGNFAMPRMSGLWHFWGNFYALSAVFSVHTDDKDVIDTMNALIADNKTRPDYLAARDELTKVENDRRLSNIRRTRR